METQRQVSVQAKMMARRQVAKLMIEKGMETLCKELLEEGRVVSETDLQGQKQCNADTVVRERLCLALARRNFHAILGDLLSRQPSLLGVEPTDWQSDWAKRL